MIFEIPLLAIILLNVFHEWLESSKFRLQYEGSVVGKFFNFIFSYAIIFYFFLVLLVLSTAGTYLFMSFLPVNTFGVSNSGSTSIKECSYVSEQDLQEIRDGKYVIHTSDNCFLFATNTNVEKKAGRYVFVLFSKDAEYITPKLVKVKLKTGLVYPWLLSHIFPAYKYVFVVNPNDYEYTQYLPEWYKDLRTGSDDLLALNHYLS